MLPALALLLLTALEVRGPEAPVTPLIAEPNTGGDRFDLGFGLNLGSTPGLKIRALEELESGLDFGLDVDGGSLLLFRLDATASGLLGFTFHARGSNLVRPYVALGAGWSGTWAFLGGYHGGVLRPGIGLEWKPTSWFGLGLEGALMLCAERQSARSGSGDDVQAAYAVGSIAYSQVRLTAILYAL
jgi:hypothetical protein